MSIRKNVLSIVSNMDDKNLRNLNKFLAEMQVDTEEPKEVKVKKINSNKSSAKADVEEIVVPKFATVKEAIMEALDIPGTRAKAFYEMANENAFDWELKPRALKAAILALAEEQSDDDAVETEEETEEKDVPHFREVREQIIEALDCTVKAAHQFYKAVNENDFDWNLKPNALKRAIKEAYEEISPEDEETVVKAKPAAKKEKASSGDEDFTAMSKTALREAVIKLQVKPSQAGADLAKFLKRVYTLAEGNKIRQLEKMGEEKNVRFFFGRGKQTELGKKRKMAAQILCG
jgi:hypothetical protein